MICNQCSNKLNTETGKCIFCGNQQAISENNNEPINKESIQQTSPEPVIPIQQQVAQSITQVSSTQSFQQVDESTSINQITTAIPEAISTASNNTCENDLKLYFKNDSIIDKNYNFHAGLWNSLYFFYRKAFSLGLIAIIFQVILIEIMNSIFNQSIWVYYVILFIIFTIICNKILIFDAKRQIKKMKKKHGDEYQQALAKRKATSMGAFIIALLITLIVVPAIPLILKSGIGIQDFTDYYKQSEFSFQAEGFQRMRYDGELLDGVLTNEDSCSIRYRTYPSDYGKFYTEDTPSEQINGNKWYIEDKSKVVTYVNRTTGEETQQIESINIIYTHPTNKFLYSISFEDAKNSSECKEAFDKVKNTMKIE